MGKEIQPDKYGIKTTRREDFNNKTDDEFSEKQPCLEDEYEVPTTTKADEQCVKGIDGMNNKDKIIEVINNQNQTARSITGFNFMDYCVKCYCTDRFLEDKVFKDFFFLMKSNPFQFEYDYNKYNDIFLDSVVIVIYKDKIHSISRIVDTQNISIQGKYSEEMYNNLMKYIEEKNPLRNKNLQMVQTNQGISYQMKKFKEITLDDIVIDDIRKEDLRDNTLFHLKEFNDSNGIILFGPPGAGKSLVCSCIMYEAIKEGYSTCFITTKVEYGNLEQFFEKMLSPCIVIIEDIDTIGGDRRKETDSNLSSLLQMLNGLSERKGKVVFIATTNYIDLLDDALKNRPLRFNRKMEIDFPENNQIDELVDLYFKDEKITNDNKKLCYDKKFTGAHIKELKRTCDIKIKKNKDKKSYNDVFKICVDIIKENFYITKSEMGFKK